MSFTSVVVVVGMGWDGIGLIKGHGRRRRRNNNNYLISDCSPKLLTSTEEVLYLIMKSVIFSASFSLLLHVALWSFHSMYTPSLTVILTPLVFDHELFHSFYIRFWEAKVIETLRAEKNFFTDYGI